MSDPTLQLERGVLSALLADPALVMPIYDLVKPDDLLLPTHKDVLAAAVAIVQMGSVPTVGLLSFRLASAGNKAIAGMIVEISATKPSTSPLEDARAIAQGSLYAKTEEALPKAAEWRKGGKTAHSYFDALLKFAKKGLDAAEGLRPDAERPRPINLKDFLGEPRAANAWLVEDLIARESLNYLVSDPYVGKTTLAIQLSLQLAAGLDIFGMKVPERTRTLLMEAEGARDPLRERVETATREMGINPEGLDWMIQPPGAVAYDFGSRRLEDMIASSRAELVVIDTVGFFHDGDDNSATDWKKKVIIPTSRLAKEYGTSFLFVDHQVKASDQSEGWRKTRGTGAKFGDSDGFFRFEEVDNQGGRVLHVDKVRGRRAKSKIELVFLPERAIFVPDVASRSLGMLTDKQAALVTLLSPTQGGETQWTTERSLLAAWGDGPVTFAETMSELIKTKRIDRREATKGKREYKLR